MVKYHFITFATPDHMSFAEANAKSALDVGGFDTAKIYTMNDIDDYFKAKNADILNQPRGSGYWIWKPYIILKKLLEIVHIQDSVKDISIHDYLPEFCQLASIP
jgi:hypothetical protein